MGRESDGRRGLAGRARLPSRRVTRATRCSHVQGGNYVGAKGAGKLAGALEKLTGLQSLNLVRLLVLRREDVVGAGWVLCCIDMSSEARRAATHSVRLGRRALILYFGYLFFFECMHGVV